jgi:hypothetical protein
MHSAKLSFMKQWRIGPLAGLVWQVQSTVIEGSLILWLALVLIARFAIGLDTVQALAGGFLGMALFWLSDLVHNYGHAAAASAAGHPMSGIRFFWLLGTNVYPEGEPPLPASVHLRRALGGPIANGVLAIFLGLVLWFARDLRYSLQNWLFWVLVWGLLINALFYTAQVLLPMRFNDGQAVWNALRRKGQTY